jgi:hypothetical protein
MKIREASIPYVVQEIDYTALAGDIEEVFADEFGAENVVDVKIAHFNPDVIDVTIFVKQRCRDMDKAAFTLSEMLLRQGIRVAIRVASE